MTDADRDDAATQAMEAEFGLDPTKDSTEDLLLSATKMNSARTASQQLLDNAA